MFKKVKRTIRYQKEFFKLFSLLFPSKLLWVFPPGDYQERKHRYFLVVYTVASTVIITSYYSSLDSLSQQMSFMLDHLVSSGSDWNNLAVNEEISWRLGCIYFQKGCRGFIRGFCAYFYLNLLFHLLNFTTRSSFLITFGFPVVVIWTNIRSDYIDYLFQNFFASYWVFDPVFLFITQASS